MNFTSIWLWLRGLLHSLYWVPFLKGCLSICPSNYYSLGSLQNLGERVLHTKEACLITEHSVCPRYFKKHFVYIILFNLSWQSTSYVGTSTLSSQVGQSTCQESKGFPNGPVVKTVWFHCKVWSLVKKQFLHATSCDQKIKKDYCQFICCWGSKGTE